MRRRWRVAGTGGTTGSCSRHRLGSVAPLEPVQLSLQILHFLFERPNPTLRLAELLPAIRIGHGRPPLLLLLASRLPRGHDQLRQFLRCQLGRRDDWLTRLRHRHSLLFPAIGCHWLPVYPISSQVHRSRIISNVFQTTLVVEPSHADRFHFAVDAPNRRFNRHADLSLPHRDFWIRRTGDLVPRLIAEFQIFFAQLDLRVLERIHDLLGP